jgi:hydrogenase-1 operon protein HyaE
MSALDIPAPPASAGAALHPLVRRLIEERNYPLVETGDALAGLDPRDHFLFLPAHGKAHLETPDIAVVLPELIAALGGAAQIGGAVAGAKLEAALRDKLQLAVPALVVVRRGDVIGSVARMRDWDEYLARLGAVLAAPIPATH